MKKNIPLFLFAGILLVFSIPVNAQIFKKPILKATIAGMSLGEISKELLLDTGLILCSDNKYEIVCFNLSVLHQNGDLIVYNGRGNTFSQSMKAELKELPPGSKLVLEEISAKSVQDKIVKLPSIVLSIK
jgi:hypothetical protein